MASQLRLYSRELGLNESSKVFVERLSAPVVIISSVGEDSLLVYTQENLLYHFIITTSNSTVRLVQVGQIGLHGIIRAPSRVRAVTWSIPDYQLGKDMRCHLYSFMLTHVQLMETPLKM